MTITEFILARVAEDEQAARAATTGPWERTVDEHNGPNDGVDVGIWSDAAERYPVESMVIGNRNALADAAHIVRHDPERALAECAAMREIVGRLAQAERLCEANAEEHAKASRGGLANQEQITALRTHGWELRGRREALRYVVDVLAAIWSDHPDYDEGWR